MRDNICCGGHLSRHNICSRGVECQRERGGSISLQIKKKYFSQIQFFAKMKMHSSLLHFPSGVVSRVFLHSTRLYGLSFRYSFTLFLTTKQQVFSTLSANFLHSVILIRMDFITRCQIAKAEKQRRKEKVRQNRRQGMLAMKLEQIMKHSIKKIMAVIPTPKIARIATLGERGWERESSKCKNVVTNY